jgi:hypothetical protein
VIRAVDVRCTGNKGRCRGLVAVLFWPEDDPAEGVPKLKRSSITGHSLGRDLAGSVKLGCPRHNGNRDQREVELRPLLALALAQALATGKTITVPWHP